MCVFWCSFHVVYRSCRWRNREKKQKSKQYFTCNHYLSETKKKHKLEFLLQWYGLNLTVTSVEIFFCAWSKKKHDCCTHSIIKINTQTSSKSALQLMEFLFSSFGFVFLFMCDRKKWLWFACTCYLIPFKFLIRNKKEQ